MKIKKGFVEFLRIIYLIMVVVLIIAVVGGLSIYTMDHLSLYEKSQYLAVAVLVMITAFAIGLASKRAIIKPLKHILMNSISHNIRGFKYIPDAGLPVKYFASSGFIRNYNSYLSDNFITGKVENGKDFIISEILVKQVVIGQDGATSESVLFEGIFGILDASKINTFQLDIMPDVKNKIANKVIADFKKILGNKGIVRLENPEFERYFEVYSDDQIEARKVITLEFMEKLLEVRKQFGKNVTIIYIGNKIYFFVHNAVIADTRKLLLHGVSKKVIKETSDRINNICKAVELL